MNIRKSFACSLPLSLAAVLAASLSTAVADKIKTKDGKVYEGKIDQSKSDAQNIYMEVKSNGIREGKTFPRTEILEKEELGPDEEEFAKWGDMKNSADRLGQVDYETIIKEKFDAFKLKFPSSKLGATVDALKKQYTEELAKVKEGWLQLDDRWIDPKEMGWNKYAIESRIKYLNFAKAITKVKLDETTQSGVEAVYENLHSLEADYKGSPGYAAALADYGKFLETVKKQLKTAILDQPALAAKNASDLKTLTAEQQAVVSRKIQEDALTRDTLNKRYAALKPKIPLKLAYFLEAKSLQDSLKALEDDERSFLSKHSPADLAALTGASQLVAEATADEAKGNHELAYTKIDKALAAAKGLGSDSKLRAMRDRLKKMADEAIKLGGAAAGNAATGTPSGSPTPSSGGAPSAGNLSGAKAPVKAEEKPAATTASQPRRAKKAEEGGGLNLMYIAGGAIAVIGGLVAMLGKKKKKTSDDE
jgi:hypothetical protein